MTERLASYPAVYYVEAKQGEKDLTINPLAIRIKVFTDKSVEWSDTGEGSVIICNSIQISGSIKDCPQTIVISGKDSTIYRLTYLTLKILNNHPNLQTSQKFKSDEEIQKHYLTNSF